MNEYDDILSGGSSDTRRETGIYCLFCLTGHEDSFNIILNTLHMKRIDLHVIRSVVTNGKSRLEKRQLLPGYVVFESDHFTGVELDALRQSSHFVRMLSYKDNDYRLHGKDLEFVQWMICHGGVINISKVYREGDRIKVIEGPLKEFEADIVSVNKRRNCVAIQIAKGSVLNKVWCSIEIVERV